ncbi:ficolin-1-like [Drosophila albomicans]|uniref:Ficolin-1-like n=1 Tax=Drosophila albomicans TaxID=7291 RepID=A0A6P8WTY4_DROAB|nr:ficolin-1-like [Drosophila albomicans]
MKSFVCILLSVLWLALASAEFNSSISLFKKYPDSCTSAKPKKNGIYKIQVNGVLLSVYCDVYLAGSPWLVIQRRSDVSVNFYRNWVAYQQGFGDISSSFFIGLDNLNLLTVSQPHELYVHLKDFDGQTRYAKYDQFAIGNEANLYGLNTLGNYSGTAGDGLKYHLNMKFSTYDRDNDNSTRNCAVDYTGAWWYKTTHYSNLNGLYFGGDVSANQVGRGITWYHWRGDRYSYQEVHMMIRPK